MKNPIPTLPRARLALLPAIAALLCFQVTDCEARDVHISSQSSFLHYNTSFYAGDGSQGNPYYGSFDYIINNLTAANDSIYLQPGTFATTGVYLKGGQTLVGDPAGSAIQLEYHPTGQTRSALSGGFGVNGIIIQNITVECDTNYLNNLPPNQYNTSGVLLHGDNCSVSGVTVLHSATWQSGGHESGAIHIGHPGGYPWPETVNNEVVGCNVEEGIGDWFNGILWYGGGIVASNVISCTFQKDAPGFRGDSGHGINSYAHNAQFFRNFISGSGIGWYNDYGYNKNVAVYDNIIGCQSFAGICIDVNVDTFWTHEGGVDGLWIQGNVIAPYACNDGAAIYITNRHSSSQLAIKNVYISENVIAFWTSPSGPCSEIAIGTPDWADNTKGLIWNCRIVGNRIFYFGGTVTNCIAGQYWWFEGNMDMNYNPLPSQYFPNGVYYNCNFPESW